MNEKVHVRELPVGIRVVAVPLKERRSVSVGLWAAVGGRDEPASLNGISHFLEHIVFKGTRKRSAYQIKEAVEGVGGSLNAFTAEEFTCFLAKTTHRHFEQVFDVLADMVRNAAIRPEDVDKERAVILEEIKMTQDQPSQLADEILTEMLWPGHALGRPLAGSVESVGRIRRQDLADYRDRYYVAPHLVVAAAGDVNPESLVRAARRHFADRKGGARKCVEPARAVSAAPRLRAVAKKTEQTHLALGLQSFGREHPDEVALGLLSVILGGNMSSRLFNEVREKRGLAYDIGSSVHHFSDTGAFVITAGVDHAKLEEAVPLILKELHRTQSASVGAAELKRAKEFYLGQLEMSLENTMNRMLWVGENVLSIGRPKSFTEVASQVHRAGAADLKRVARELFRSESLRMAFVGDCDPNRNSRIEHKLRFP